MADLVERSPCAGLVPVARGGLRLSEVAPGPITSIAPFKGQAAAVDGLLRAQGLGWPALSALVMRWFPPSKRGAVWSTCTVSGNVAKTISPVMLTFAASLLGWRGALFGPPPPTPHLLPPCLLSPG